MQCKEPASLRIREFARRFGLWVAGGNHRWEAYIRLDSDAVPDPGELHANCLTTLYWWPNYSPKTVQEVTLLAARQNINRSLWTAMSFHDKVSSLSVKYV
jgi:hypothetical protein